MRFGWTIALSMMFSKFQGEGAARMHSFAWWPTVIVVTIATFTDLRSRRIPNWLVFPFLFLGIASSPWRFGWQGGAQGFGWHGLGQCFAGLGLGFVIYGVMFFMGGMGAGDVKLCAAIGAWIGPMQLLVGLVATSIAGGIMVFGWALMGGFFLDLFRGPGKEQSTPGESKPIHSNPLKRKMPYAPAIALGTLFSFFSLPR
jgi:prepilin peptidase CpaA